MGLKKWITGAAAVVLGVVTLTGCGVLPTGSAQKEQSETVRWFNASYAILTDLNGWNYNLFGGLAPTEINQKLEKQLLDEWWGVTDRQTADETLDWILTEGHRTTYAEDMMFFEELGLSELPEEDRETFLMENFQMEESTAWAYSTAYAAYEEYGAGAIDGWDYCRAMNLMGYYYVAGYYTEEEALDKSLEIAQTMQPLFGSWEELVDSYLRGYEYWAEESQEERRGIYEDLLTRKDNPYSVDYNITLEKTW